VTEADSAEARRIRVVAAVVERHGRYLLGRRPREKRHGGLWEFPGGKVDAGESVADAARRELDEELGLRVAGVGVHLRSVADGSSPFVIEFHEVVVDGEPVAHEHEEVGWFTPGQLSGMHLAPADRDFAASLVSAAAAEGREAGPEGETEAGPEGGTEAGPEGGTEAGPESDSEAGADARSVRTPDGAPEGTP
jgi:mutator protein MutT